MYVFNLDMMVNKQYIINMGSQRKKKNNIFFKVKIPEINMCLHRVIISRVVMLSLVRQVNWDKYERMIQTEYVVEQISTSSSIFLFIIN